MLREISRRRLQIAFVLCCLTSATVAQNASGPATSNPVYFYCYGPKALGLLARPDKVYFSDVFSISLVGSNQLDAINAFREYIVQKYSAEEFQPYCEYFVAEDQARSILNANAARVTGGAIRTGWTWVAPATDTAKPPVPHTFHH